MSNEINRITTWIQTTLQKTGKPNMIIGVSGGIDSAVSLTLCVKALGSNTVFPILLPYGDQDILDNMEICRHNLIPSKNIQVINIQEAADRLVSQLGIPEYDRVRKGNIMARLRMIILFDQAKKLDALVCGTENKSEKYLGYYTRFGDGASDLEPIQHLYKTQVWALAKEFGVPQHLIDKVPTAGLWQDQTDEKELGFSYQEADMVLRQYIDQNKKAKEIEGVSNEIVEKIIKQIESQRFKQEVPYHL